MFLRRSFVATTLASIAIGAPTGLQAQAPPYAVHGQACPPGYYFPPPPANCPPGAPYSYPTPVQPMPSGQQPTAPSQQPMTPGQQPNQQTPNQTTPSQQQQQQQQQTPQQPNQQQPAQQTPDQQANQTLDQSTAQQPQMANPTVNASQPTTAATSAQSNAPNMIGDFFGTGHLEKIIITPSPYSTRGTAITRMTTFPSATPTVPGARINVPPLATDPLEIQINQMMLPTVRTVDSYSTVNSDFMAGETMFDVRTNSATQAFAIDSLNGLFSPGDVIMDTMEVVAPTGPDFEIVSQNLTATHDSTSGASPAIPMGGRGILAEDLDNDGVLDIGEDANMNMMLDEDRFRVEMETTATPLILVTPAAINLFVPNLAAAPGANVGRMKLTENSSPLPQDRVFVNYSFFADTPLRADGLDVHRITPGFETTFFDGRMSFELRTPFASTLSSDLVQGSMGNSHDTEFGNATVFFKTLLWQDSCVALAAGVGVAVPTASDFEVRTSSGVPLLEVENEAPHVLPFIGGVWNPNPRCFVQGLCQFDVDPVGNSVFLSDFEMGQPTGKLTNIGRPNDSTYVFADLGIGYWLYRNTCHGGCLTGFAPTLELHYNRTVDDAENINTGHRYGHSHSNSNNVSFTDQSTQQLDLFNGLVGATAVIRDDATVTVAYVTPLSQTDEQFNGELRVIVNLLFGCRSRNNYLRAVPF